MALKRIPFNAVEHFLDSQAQAELIADALESNDAGYIKRACEIVAKARGLEIGKTVPDFVAMLHQMNFTLELKPLVKNTLG